MCIRDRVNRPDARHLYLNAFSDRVATRPLDSYHIYGAYVGIRWVPTSVASGLSGSFTPVNTSSPNRHFSVVTRQALKVLRFCAQGFRGPATYQRLVPNSTRHTRDAQRKAYEMIWGTAANTSPPTATTQTLGNKDTVKQLVTIHGPNGVRGRLWPHPRTEKVKSLPGCTLRRLTLRGSPGMTPRRVPVYLLQVYLLFLGIETDVSPSARGTFSPSPTRGRRAGWTGRSYRPFWTAGGPSSVTGVGSPGRCRHSSLVLVPSHRNLSISAAVFRRPAFLGCTTHGI